MSTETVKDITSFIGLKVIAVIVIFIYHSHVLLNKVNLGGRMCEFLFVVSGFLVAYNFLKKDIVPNVYNSFQYFCKKFEQFYPIHIITFLLSMFAFYGFDLVFFISNLLLVQSWAFDFKIVFSYNGVAWFLSSILFSYFLAPMFMFFVKKPIKNIIFILIFVLYMRIVLEILPDIVNYKLWTIRFGYNPAIKFLEFFAGMLLVPIFNYVRMLFKNNDDEKIYTRIFNVLEIIIFISAVLLCLKTSFDGCFYIPFFCLFVFIFAFNKGMLSKILSSKIFLFLGSFQLIFFMMHQMIIRFFMFHIHLHIHDIYLRVTVILIVAMLVSYLYSRFLDKKLVLLFRKLMSGLKNNLSQYFSIFNS